jgi:hypothetical protein
MRLCDRLESEFGGMGRKTGVVPRGVRYRTTGAATWARRPVGGNLGHAEPPAGTIAAGPSRDGIGPVRRGMRRANALETE